MRTCPTCNGSGKIENLSRVNRAGLNELISCPRCQKIERAPDYNGWLACYGDRLLGMFPSYHVAAVACEIEAAVQSARTSS